MKKTAQLRRKFNQFHARHHAKYDYSINGSASALWALGTVSAISSGAAPLLIGLYGFNAAGLGGLSLLEYRKHKKIEREYGKDSNEITVLEKDGKFYTENGPEKIIYQMEKRINGDNHFDSFNKVAMTRTQYEALTLSSSTERHKYKTKLNRLKDTKKDKKHRKKLEKKIAKEQQFRADVLASKNVRKLN